MPPGLLKAEINLDITCPKVLMNLATQVQYWAIQREEKGRLETSKMQYYRKMLKILWIDSVSNERILDRMTDERVLNKDYNLLAML